MADNEDSGVLNTAGNVLGWGFRTFIWDTNDSLASNALKIGLTGAAVIAAPFSFGGSFAARGALTAGAHVATKLPATARLLAGAGEGIAGFSTKVAPKLTETLSPLFKAPVINKATGIATGDTKISLGRTATTLGVATFATSNMDSMTEAGKVAGGYVIDQALENVLGVNRVLDDPLGRLQASMSAGHAAPQGSFASGAGGATGFQVVDVPEPQEGAHAATPDKNTNGPGKSKKNDENGFNIMHLLSKAGDNPLPILASGMGFMMGGPISAILMGVLGYMLNKTQLGGAINNWISSGIKGFVNDSTQLAKDVTRPNENTTGPRQTLKQDDIARPTVEVNNPDLLHVKTLDLTDEFAGAGAVPQRSPHVLAFDAAVNNRVQPAMATAIPAHLVPGTTSNVGKDFHVAVANEADHGHDPEAQRQLAVNAPAMTLKT